jgi:hypothetical protein
MKKLISWAKRHETLLTLAGMAVFAILLFISLSSCSSPTKSSHDAVTVVVKNSLWQTVKTITVSDRGAREIVSDDYQAEIDAYNTETLDDFLRAYNAGEVPDIANAPPVSVYICNPVTYAVNWSVENVPRISLIENYAGWKQDSVGQILFIDHVPPPPIITPPPSLYAWYAIYEVDNITGAILLEDHCGYLSDDTFVGQWITMPEGTTAPDGTPGGGWSSVDAYYQTILHAYQSDSIPTYNHCHVVTRQIYTPPVQ